MLPDQVRPALLWTIRLDSDGSRTDVEVERALVRSTAKLTYEEAQRSIDDGTASEPLQLLKEVGLLRLTREAARGGITLPTLEQEVHVEDDRFRLEFRDMLPVESWNAQMSLLTGFAAASLMVYARVGLLRTLPDPDHRDVQRLHRTARALGIEWPAELLYADLIRKLDPTKADQAALIVASTRLLRRQRVRRVRRRGSGRAPARGRWPPSTRTSPRRCAGWPTATRPRCASRCARATTSPTGCGPRCRTCPRTMQRTGQLAARYERMVLDLVEAGVLQSHVAGDLRGRRGRRERPGADPGDGDGPRSRRRGARGLREPLPLGTEARVRLTTADVAARKVEFTLG